MFWLQWLYNMTTPVMFLSALLSVGCGLFFIITFANTVNAKDDEDRRKVAVWAAGFGVATVVCILIFIILVSMPDPFK